jgi:ribosomal protein S18 acetylase RimI-like enzyme
MCAARTPETAEAMDAGYRIRHAVEADGPAVERELGAYLAHIGAALDPAGLDHDVAEWRGEYDGVTGVLMVVEDAAGQVIGTAGVRQLEPGVGELKRMWIRPARQGRGLGRQLLDRCLAEARRLGFSRVRLDTQRRMQSALALYRAYEFREVADYNGNPRAEVWMELTVTGKGTGHGESSSG